MNHRVELEQDKIDVANANILNRLTYRLAQKGRGSFIGSHETLGIIAEEYDELKDAVRSDDPQEVERELVDIAVACILGIASRYQNAKAADEEMAKKSERKFGAR